MNLDEDRSRKGVKTTNTVFDILEHLKRVEGAGVTAIADAVGKSKGTVHKHLVTLERRGYVVHVNDEYRVALRFLDLGNHAREHFGFYPVAKPKVDELAESTGEKCWLIAEEHGQGVHLYGATGKHHVQTYARVGEVTSLQQHAAGKAILGHLPRERVDEIIAQHGLPKKTENTITDVDRLYDELDKIREQGYAFNMEETVAGLCAIGAPLTDEDDIARGAISISGPANRLKGDFLYEELPDLLLGATNEIEINYAFS